MSEDIWRWNAGRIAGAVAKRDISASEAVESCVARMHAVNPALNAVTLDLSDQARAGAKALDAACARAVQSPKFVAGMKQLEQSIAYLPGDRFTAVLASDADSKKMLIESSGIRLEQ